MRAGTRAIWGLIVAGTVARVVLAFTTDGQPYDIEFLRDLRGALGDSGVDVYSVLMGPDNAVRWPYPPGFFPLAWLAGAASDVTGLAYTSLVRFPAIAADAAIAWIVQDHLRDQRRRRHRAPWESDAVGPLYAATMLALWALYVFFFARIVRQPRQAALA